MAVVNFYARMPSGLGPLLMQSDGVALSGLYFIGQKDCPNVAGFEPMRTPHFDPSAGEYEGRPIRELKAYRHLPGEEELFPSDTVVPGLKGIHHSGDVHISARVRDKAAGLQLRPKSSCGSTSAKDRNGTSGLACLQADTPALVLKLFERTRAELDEYFGGRRRVFEMPLHLHGTAFQQKVWEALLRIPYGELLSYGDVARNAGLSSRHSRAVGAAVGSNPLTIIVPCHRVVAGSGALNGYGGGLSRKQALLELEGFVVA
jgi:methylated-DNA-[protein]-cysteine S-methyltransferase